MLILLKDLLSKQFLWVFKSIWVLPTISSVQMRTQKGLWKAVKQQKKLYSQAGDIRPTFGII